MIKFLGGIVFWCMATAQGASSSMTYARAERPARISEPACLICSNELPADDDEMGLRHIALCNGRGAIIVLDNWEEAVAARESNRETSSDVFYNFYHFFHIACIQAMLKGRNSCPGCGNHFSGNERRALLGAGIIPTKKAGKVDKSC